MKISNKFLIKPKNNFIKNLYGNNRNKKNKWDYFDEIIYIINKIFLNSNINIGHTI
jgi:hypothetical protein